MEPFIGVSGPIQTETISRRTGREKIIITAPSTTVVEASTFYYPGWEARIDGKPVVITPAPGSGTIRFQVPEGRHTVSLDFHNTPVRRWTLIFSLMTALLLAAAVFTDIYFPAFLSFHKVKSKTS